MESAVEVWCFTAYAIHGRAGGAPNGRMENGSSIWTPISSIPVAQHRSKWLETKLQAVLSA